MLYPVFFGGANRMAIKSITPISITLNGVTSNTQTITSVDTNNAFILFNGVEFPSTTINGAHTGCRLELTNATTVTARVNTSSSQNIVVKGWVVELVAGSINSIQASTISVTGTSGVGTNTATITSVNTAKSIAIWLGATMGAPGGNVCEAWTNITLTNATTVTADYSIDGSLTTAIVGYMVVEFK